MAEKDDIIEQEDNEPDMSVGHDGEGVAISQAQLDEFHKVEEERSVPGKGSLFHVDKKWLPESSRLTDREIISFAIGITQREMLNKKRTESLFDVFMGSVLQLKISKDGDGRKEHIVLHQLESDKQSQSAMGGANFG